MANNHINQSQFLKSIIVLADSFLPWLGPWQHSIYWSIEKTTTIKCDIIYFVVKRHVIAVKYNGLVAWFISISEYALSDATSLYLVNVRIHCRD